MKIDGKKIAQVILFELKSKPIPEKFLAIFLVGSDPASVSFINQKEKFAKELGVDFRLYKYDESITNDELREKMRKVVSAKKCGGAVLQLPLPKHLNPNYLINIITPNKDVEVLSERTLGSFHDGRSKILPPSVAVIDEIFKYLNIDVASLKSIVVVGQGQLVGKPVTTWFLGKIPQVHALDKKSDFSVLKNTDLAVLGTGDALLFKASMFKKGCGVIDFGYGTDKQGKIGGDFDPDSLQETGVDYLRFYTPTPGGTGPVLVACLFKNFYVLNSKN